MNRLYRSRRTQVIRCLVEGNSIRATSRITGVSKITIQKLLPEIGLVCARFQDQAFRNLHLTKIQCDEIWSFCYAKNKNLPADKQEIFGYGSVWTWTALNAETKLVPCWMVAPRDTESAREFMNDLASRLAVRVQLTTDGHKPYLEAVEGAFGAEIDYAMLVKLYGEDSQEEKRYSPAKCLGARKTRISGKPDDNHISTSYVERQNLTMRMHMRRFTRLTNAFSKKLENHIAAISLHFMYYNFCRIHQTWRVTPAMAAGVTDRAWDVEDIVRLLEAEEAEQADDSKTHYGAALGHEPIK